MEGQLLVPNSDFYVRTLVRYLHFRPITDTRWNPFDPGFGISRKIWSYPKCQSDSTSCRFRANIWHFITFASSKWPKSPKRYRIIEMTEMTNPCQATVISQIFLATLMQNLSQHHPVVLGYDSSFGGKTKLSYLNPREFWAANNNTLSRSSSSRTKLSTQPS